jgi:NADH-quinone oxidoreductase subunit C
VANDAPSAQRSLLVDHEHGVAVAKFLRDDGELRLDYCSNATGIDWPEVELTEKIKVKKVVDGVEKEVEEVKKTVRPAYLEAVYHLYSMERKHGPVIIRLRTENRTDKTRLPSLTPIWRGCEFQEREIFDLYGIMFDGHPDLRRILLGDDWVGHPLRKDSSEAGGYHDISNVRDNPLDQYLNLDRMLKAQQPAPPPAPAAPAPKPAEPPKGA